MKLFEMFSEEGIVQEAREGIALGFEQPKEGIYRAIAYDMTGPKEKVVHVGEFDDLDHMISVMGAKFGRDFTVLGSNMKPMRSDVLGQRDLVHMAVGGASQEVNEANPSWQNHKNTSGNSEDNPVVGFEKLDGEKVRAIIYLPNPMNPGKNKIDNIIESDDLFTVVNMLDDEYGDNWSIRGSDGNVMSSDTLSRGELAQIALDGGKQETNESTFNEGGFEHLSPNIGKAIANGADIYDIMKGKEVPQKDREILQRQYDIIAGESGFHADDDFESIMEIMADRIYDIFAEQTNESEPDRKSAEQMKRDLEYSKQRKEVPQSKEASDMLARLRKKKKGVNEARVTDPTALAVKKVATELIGKPYSSARIAGGKAHRLSIKVDQFLDKYYRQVSINKIEPHDKEMLVQLKSRLYNALQQEGIDTTLVDIKFHTGAGVYMSVRTKIENEEFGEARGDSLGRKFNKAFWWDKYSDPKDMMKRVRAMSDKDLISLAKGGIDDHQPGGSGTPREFQIKLIKRELKRRFGVKPGQAGLEEEVVPVDSNMDDYEYYEKEGYKFWDNETGELFKTNPDEESGEYDPNWQDKLEPLGQDDDYEEEEPNGEDPRVDYKLLARMIAEKASEVFPDGDPFDALMPYVNKLKSIGLDPMSHLDIAANKYLGVRDYHDYLATFYDDATPGGSDSHENPWRAK